MTPGWTPDRTRSLRRAAARLALAAPLLVVTPLAFMAPAPSALAAPQPEPVPRRWELEFTPGPLRVASFDLAGGGPRVFYYFSYKVVNKSGADRWFAPSFEMDTGDGTIYRSGRDVPREVVEKLIQASGNSELEDEVKIQGQLLQGPENAKEGIVVFPCTSLKPEYVNIYCAGFSGENKSVARPDNGQTVVLRKQRWLGHTVNGEIDPDSRATLARSTDQWILRK